jgi:hypothetical protein
VKLVSWNVNGLRAVLTELHARETSGVLLTLGTGTILVAAGPMFLVLLLHPDSTGRWTFAPVTSSKRSAPAGLNVIACVGETHEQREAGEMEDVLRRQLAVLDPHPDLVLAYEPVWAIGTGLTATPEMAQEAHAFIKSLLDAPVLYGGSVKPDNAGTLLAQPDVDGALVGGASLEIDSFKAICQTAARIPS